MNFASVSLLRQWTQDILSDFRHLSWNYETVQTNARAIRDFWACTEIALSVPDPTEPIPYEYRPLGMAIRFEYVDNLVGFCKC